MVQFTGRRWLLALALLVVLGIARASGASDEKEPIYGGKRLSEWVAGLNRRDSKRYEATRTALRKVDLKEFPSLLDALKSQNVRFRLDAIAVLIAIGPKAAGATKALIPLLKDNDDLVRMNATFALGQFGSKAAGGMKALVPLLKDKDTIVQITAGQSLILIGKEIAQDRLRFQETHKQIGNKTTASAKKEMDRIDAEVKAVIPVLLDALKGEVDDVRHPILHTLRLIGPDAKAVPAFVDALKDKRALIRCVAARALGAIGSEAKPAVTSLTKALEDSDPEVRNRAATALVLIDRDKAPSMVKRLVAALKDKDIDVRADAAWSLGEIGPAAKSALPQLIESLRDKPAVRREARAAIKKIEREGAGEQEKKKVTVQIASDRTRAGYTED